MKTFFNKYGASTTSLHLLSVVLTEPSFVVLSAVTSLPTKTGINGDVGNRLSYAYITNY